MFRHVSARLARLAHSAGSTARHRRVRLDRFGRFLLGAIQHGQLQPGGRVLRLGLEQLRQFPLCLCIIGQRFLLLAEFRIGIAASPQRPPLVGIDAKIAL